MKGFACGLDRFGCHIATIGFIGLLAVLAVGCSRMTAEEEADVRKSFGIPADVPMKDLGEVEFRAGIPKRVRPAMVPANWQLYVPQMGQHFVVAMRPTVIP